MRKQNNRDLSIADLNKITNVAIAMVLTKFMELQCKKWKIEWRMLRIRATSMGQFHKKVVWRGFRISEGFGLGFGATSPSNLLFLRVGSL